MFVSIEHQGEITVIALDGNLDAVTAPRLTDCLGEQLAHDHKKLIIGLSAVAYLGNAGLREILAALKEARQAGGDVRLAAVQPSAQKVFDMSGLASILEFHPSAREAVKSFSRNRPGTTPTSPSWQASPQR